MIAKGTVVGFNAGARLRQITKEGQMAQRGMGDGVLIGEQLRGEIVFAVQPNGYAVTVDGGKWYGWVYNYELYELDPK